MYGNAIATLPSGETLIAGTTYEHKLYSPNGGLIATNGYYGFIARFDSKGKMLMEKSFESEEETFHVIVTSMVAQPDGGAILAGTASAHDAPQSDVLVLRLNARGDILWKKSFGTKYFDHFVSLIGTEDGGFVVTALGGYEYTEFHALLIKGTASGKIVWKKFFKVPGNKFGVYPSTALSRSPNGGFLFVSVSEFEEEKYGLLLIKFSPAGKVQWKEILSLGKRNILWDEYYPKTSVQATTDGGYIIASTSHSEENRKGAVELIKIDDRGKVLWAKNYDHREPIWIFGKIEQTSDGGYLLGGSLGMNWDSVVMKFSEQGSPVWTRIFAFGPGRADGIYATTEAANGDYLATGTLVDTQQPTAVPGRLPIFNFSPIASSSCSSFREVSLTHASHPISTMKVKLVFYNLHLSVRSPKLETEEVPLKASDCRVVWN